MDGLMEVRMFFKVKLRLRLLIRMWGVFFLCVKFL